jgi:hypothetical protein
MPLACRLITLPLWWWCSKYVDLSDKKTGVIYYCCWPSPAQSFSSPSPARLMTTFYCLRFKIPPTWKARSPYLYPTGTRWPSCTPKQSSLFVAFYNLQGYSGCIWTHLHMGLFLNQSNVLLTTFQHGLRRKHHSSVAVQLLPLKQACLRSRYLETVVV